MLGGSWEVPFGHIVSQDVVLEPPWAHPEAQGAQGAISSFGRQCEQTIITFNTLRALNTLGGVARLCGQGSAVRTCPSGVRMTVVERTSSNWAFAKSDDVPATCTHSNSEQQKHIRVDATTAHKLTFRTS